MGTKSVTRDQFEITENTITHKPTGIVVQCQNERFSGTLRQVRQDRNLPTAEEYSPEEVKRMIRLLAEEQSLNSE